MARNVRLEYAGAFYHVVRGNRRQPIFHDAEPKLPANRTYRSSLQHQAHGQRQAEELFAAGLRQHQLSGAQLARLAGTDSGKVAVAREPWEQTTASQSWIADRLRMKSAANVSQILCRSPAMLSKDVERPLSLNVLIQQ